MLRSRSEGLNCQASVALSPTLALYHKTTRVFFLKTGVHWLLSSIPCTTFLSFSPSHYSKNSLFLCSIFLLLCRIISLGIIQFGFHDTFVPVMQKKKILQVITSHSIRTVVAYFVKGFFLNELIMIFVAIKVYEVELVLSNKLHCLS